MRSNYHIVVAWGYIAILAMILWVLSVPTIWRIVFLVVSALGVAVPMYMTREPFPRWKPDDSTSEQNRSSWNASGRPLHLGRLAGLIIMLFFAVDAARNEKLWRVQCIGLYWHFVDLIWIFLFPMFYIAR